MKISSLIRIHFVCFFLLTSAAAAAQDRSLKSADPETERVHGMVRQAWDEEARFTKAGGKTGDDNHPAERWARTLWQYREQHPDTPAAALATSESLHLLVHAGLMDEMRAKAETLRADDKAWKELLHVLQEAAAKTKDDSFFLTKAGFLLRHSTDKQIKAGARFAQGVAYQQKKDDDRARIAFQAAIDEDPNGRLTEEARGKLYEISHLGVGQKIPLFAARSAGGAVISLADYKGKVVVLDFWSTSCGVCVADFPLLKETYAKYKDQGLVILGVSLDGKSGPLQKMVAEKAVAWPQLFDGKGFDGAVAKLFNVRGTPTYYVVGRDGKIAASRVPGKELSEVMASVMRSDPPRDARAEQSNSDDEGHESDRVVRAMNLKPGEFVVDIGAGTGVFTRRFAAVVGSDGRAVGLEIDPLMVKRMTADAESNNIKNYEARLVLPDDPVLAQGSADVVFLSNTYHHLTDRVAYLTKVKGALRPGGRIVIVDYVKTDSNSGNPSEPRFSKEEVTAELRRAGYRLARELDFLLPRQYFLEFVLGSNQPT